MDTNLQNKNMKIILENKFEKQRVSFYKSVLYISNFWYIIEELTHEYTEFKKNLEILKVEENEYDYLITAQAKKPKFGKRGFRKVGD